MAYGIPKIIHYGWFGGKEKSKFINQCIGTWKKFLPDYEIKEWNEQNFNMETHLFAKEAYAAGKYAFVSDYLRVYVLYHYGGIYFDTDIEILENFDNKLVNASFVMAFEQPDTLMTGFMAAGRENPVIKQFLAYYDNLSFYDENGAMRLTPNPDILAGIATNFGIVFNGQYQESGEGIRIFPNEVFGGYDVYNMVYRITENTVLVHHYTASWRTFREKMLIKSRKTFLKLFGAKAYRKMRRLKHMIKGDKERYDK